MGQRYRKMEDQKQKPGLPCYQDFAKGGQDLNQNLISKNCKLGEMTSKLVSLKRITDSGLGAKPPAAGRFFVMFEKKLQF